MQGRKTKGILGIFTDLEPCLVAVRQLAALGKKDVRVYSPIQAPEIQDALGKKPSPLGYFTLIGAITGTVSGFALAAYTTYQYSLITAGQPLAAWIPWGVIGFEFTILFGCLFNFAAMVLMSGLYRIKRPPGYDERFSVDRFGVFVSFQEGEDTGVVRELLEKHKPEEIQER